VGLSQLRILAKGDKISDPEEKYAENKLTSTDKSSLCNYMLCKFVVETRKTNGEHYTPRRLYLLLCGLQRYMKSLGNAVNLLHGAEFTPLKNCFDSLCKRLHAKVIGAKKKETPSLSGGEEDKLWDNGVLNLDSPLYLLQVVFFYNGKILLKGWK